jgi:hypothetical protein
MWDLFKGFGLLVLAVVTLSVGYAAWMTLMPVSRSDVEMRIAHVCTGGQMIAGALNGETKRPVSCECVHDGLLKTVGAETMVKGAEALRQMLVAQVWRAAQGEKPGEIDKALMADRDVLNFMSALDRLGRECAASPFAAATPR